MARDAPQRRDGGADEEFSAFYREFVPVLVAFLQNYGCELFEARDIAQETMLKLYSRWAVVEHRGAWSYRMAFREYSARHPGPGARSADAFPDNVTALADDARSLWKREHDLLMALEDLPRRQREVMAWTLEGYSPAEVAYELGLTPSEVRSNLYEARTSLQSWFNAKALERSRAPRAEGAKPAPGEAHRAGGGEP